MIAGTLDQIISIYKPEVREGKYGNNKTDYVPYIFKARARVQDRRGTRTNENGEVYYSYAVTFTIRAYHKVDGFMIIKYNGLKYRIINIAPPDRIKNEIKIDAELINE